MLANAVDGIAGVTEVGPLEDHALIKFDHDASGGAFVLSGSRAAAIHEKVCR